MRRRLEAWTSWAHASHWKTSAPPSSSSGRVNSSSAPSTELTCTQRAVGAGELAGLRAERRARGGAAGRNLWRHIEGEVEEAFGGGRAAVAAEASHEALELPAKRRVDKRHGLPTGGRRGRRAVRGGAPAHVAQGVEQHTQRLVGVLLRFLRCSVPWRRAALRRRPAPALPQQRPYAAQQRARRHGPPPLRIQRVPHVRLQVAEEAVQGVRAR